VVDGQGGHRSARGGVASRAGGGGRGHAENRGARERRHEYSPNQAGYPCHRLDRITGYRIPPAILRRMDSRRLAIRRIAVYAVVTVTVVGALAITGSIPSSDEARDFIDDLGAAGPVLYVPLFVLVNFAVAWPILAGAGGLLFGTAAGTPQALLGVTAAALTQMAIARWLAGEHRGRLLPQRTRRLENFLTENGAVAVMESRIVPLVPYGVVNYSAGLTQLSYAAMAAGTLIGAAPKVFVFTALGGSLDDITSPEALVALAVWVLVGIAGAILLWRQTGGNPLRRGGPETPPEPSARPQG
jgi:uncharacterized membrane protein YdjX (TVP38/TMEM64 family)